ncbi:MAG: hypothetical protein Q8R37_04790 [Nanoarchaeota archaeon]|nr:hypothetical protein [Nanoarchaeota archaeon]
MKMRRVIPIIILVFVISTLAEAATIKGSVYNTQLELEKDVLVEINTIPLQKVLATDGRYSFELSPGTYTLTARKGLIEISEEVTIIKEGIFTLDIFLLPGFSDEDQLWQDTDTAFFDEDDETPRWAYWVTAVVIILLLFRIFRARHKYGSLRKFRHEARKEQRKTIDEIKADIANEPGYTEKVLEIMATNDGRISQKELRKELLPLSEAKVSLIITELEHLGKIEKIKKGRGNVLILKQEEDKTNKP